MFRPRPNSLVRDPGNSAGQETGGHRFLEALKGFPDPVDHIRLFIFFHVKENETKRKRPSPEAPSGLPCASHNRPMKRRLMLTYCVLTLARVLTIWRLLCASLHVTPCLAARCLLHRPVDTAGARGNSPACRRAQTVRALLPVRAVDARLGTKGKPRPKDQKLL